MVPTIFSVGTTEPMDYAVRIASLHRLKERFRCFLEVFGVNKLFPAEILKLLERLAAVLKCFSIDVDRLPGCRRRPEHRRYRFDNPL
jgi:hypothetical protein